MEETNVKTLLNVLRASCLEGYDGTWDCAGEKREAFLDMIEVIEQIAGKLGIQLEER